MLNRLRRLLDDPLFIRGTGGMIPTARAVELIEPVRKVLRDIEVIVTGRAQFDAVSAKHRFAIGGNDYVEYFLLPGLMKERLTWYCHCRSDLRLDLLQKRR